MKNFCKNIVLFLVLLACVFTGTSAFAAGANSAVNEDFVAFAKKAVNPLDLGYNKKLERFFPYSTRYGRRIAYDIQKAAKPMFSEGISISDSVSRLEKNLKDAEKKLLAYIAEKFPSYKYDSLSETQKQMLLIRAYVSDFKDMPQSFCSVVLLSDWRRLVDEMLYTYNPDGWPDRAYNKAFFDRWINADSSMKR